MLNDIIYFVTKKGITQNINSNVLVARNNTMKFVTVELTDKHVVNLTPVKTPMWIGHDIEFSIPTYNTNRNINKIKVDINDWIKFFGLWSIDGSITSKIDTKYRRTVITTKVEIDDLLNKLPFHFVRYDLNNIIRYEIYNTQLATYLNTFGNKKNRRLPDFLFDLPEEKIKLFLKWVYYGSSKDNRVTSTSKQLIHDIATLNILVGNNIYIRKWKSGLYVLTKTNKKFDMITGIIPFDINAYIYVIYNGYGGWYKYES